MYVFKDFDTDSNNLLNAAISIAASYGHIYVGSEHLLIACTLSKQCKLHYLMEIYGVSAVSIGELTCEMFGKGKKCNLSPDDFSKNIILVLEKALSESAVEKSLAGTLNIEKALLSLAASSSEKIFSRLGIKTQKLITELSTAKLRGALNNKIDPKIEPKASTSLLEKYGKDLTRMAAAKHFDPCIGRQKELRQLMMVLCRRQKNNPCLIGEAGVGKTAIVEGLANLIVADMVPEKLKNKKIYSVELASIVSGTKYRGDFEQRFQGIIEDAQKQRCILFIDEIHSITSAGGAEGAIEAANLIKPSLARGELQLIGATTIGEYRQHIEKDGALDRRFAQIMVDEPSPEQATEIMFGLRECYEKFHSLVIEDEAIKAAVELSARYINTKQLPDKAIDLLDMAAAAKQLQSELSSPLLTQQDITATVSSITGIPLNKLTANEKTQLLQLEKRLNSVVFGQCEAVAKITKAIARAKLMLSEKGKPQGSFLFLGATGVGKTKLAKTVAEICYKNPKAFIRFDMSEYMEKHSVAKLIGAPAGYVGHEKPGQLTDLVRTNPYCTLLFDELEKADSEVLNILLSILDEGFLTDSKGRKVDFQNTLIIMTSNIAAEKIKHSATGLGFSGEHTPPQKLAQKELLKFMRPELVGRIENIVVFQNLDEKSLCDISQNLVFEFCQRLLHQNIKIQVSKEVVCRIAKKALEQNSGARAINDIIKNELESVVISKLLNGGLNGDEGAKFYIQKGDIRLKVYAKVPVLC